jgi:hypothetical protein
MHAVLHYPLSICQGSKTCGAVAKGNWIPFSNPCGNRELHATPIMSTIYCWENFIKISKIAATVFLFKNSNFLLMSHIELNHDENER